MTTTRYSLDKIKDIIDEYVKQKFDGIFLRAINPYGLAEQNKSELGYPIDNFIEMYKQALEYNHSKVREVCFLLTHGLLHLLGYDHIEEDDEIIMFKKQEELLNEYEIQR